MNKKKIALKIARSPRARRWILRLLKNRRVQRLLARGIQRRIEHLLRRS